MSDGLRMTAAEAERILRRRLDCEAADDLLDDPSWQALDFLMGELKRKDEALREAEEAMHERWRDLLDSADTDDECGAHIGLARYSRTRAEGVGDAILILRSVVAARAALEDETR